MVSPDLRPVDGDLINRLTGWAQSYERRVGRLRAAGPASFFGLKSAGMTQVRGYSRLVLGEDRLISVMCWPRRVVLVPLARLRVVDTVPVWLGKAKSRPLLHLDWGEDEGAWLVRDLSAWQTLLRPAAADERDEDERPRLRVV